MPATDLQRITDFRMAFARRQAAVVREVPGGAAVLDPGYAAAHDHNQLLIDGPATPAELLALAGKTLGHLPYRRITIFDDATGTACAQALAAAGYDHDIELVMTHAGDRPAPAAPAQPVTLDEMRLALTRQLCAWMPQAAEGLFSQSMALGWDQEKGGFFYTLDWNDVPAKRSKLWWPVSEGAGAAHFLNHHFPSDFHEGSYRKIWNIVANAFLDHEHGGWHEELTEDLQPASTLFPGKGDIYHALQACLIPLYPAEGSLTKMIVESGGKL